MRERSIYSSISSITLCGLGMSLISNLESGPPTLKEILPMPKILSVLDCFILISGTYAREWK